MIAAAAAESSLVNMCASFNVASGLLPSRRHYGQGQAGVDQLAGVAMPHPVPVQSHPELRALRIQRSENGRGLSSPPSWPGNTTLSLAGFPGPATGHSPAGGPGVGQCFDNDVCKEIERTPDLVLGNFMVISPLAECPVPGARAAPWSQG